MWLSNLTDLYAFGALIPQHASILHQLTDVKSRSTRPAGSWELKEKRAMSLFPKEDSILKIMQGRAWVTLGDGVHDRDAHYGDHVLEAGQTLMVHAGQRVVFESLDSRQTLYFDFRPCA